MYRQILNTSSEGEMNEYFAGGRGVSNFEKLPRRESRNLRQREKILGTALKLFSEKGYHNVSTHEIAKEAEFGARPESFAGR
jgi:hypothetical protein